MKKMTPTQRHKREKQLIDKLIDTLEDVSFSLHKLVEEGSLSDKMRDEMKSYIREKVSKHLTDEF